MEKVIIIGCAGSGKSTLARELRDRTGLPLYYLDQIWHKPDKTTVSREEFDEKLAEIMQKDRWIIDGNYSRTLGVRLRECDTVFFFDLPTKVCLDGAAARIGTKREDLPWLEEEFDEEFRQWIMNFRENNLPKLYRLLEEYGKDKEVVIFKSRDEVNNYLKTIDEK